VKALLDVPRAFVITLGVFILTAAMEGCIAVPIPTPESGEGLSHSQVQEQLTRGKFSRVDALLTFAEPTWRRGKDRFFIYQWNRSHWSYVVIFLFGGGTAEAVYHPHYLALEFDTKGELKRHKYFSGWFARDSFEFFNTIFPEWVNAQNGDSP
jgi:hypothetical protein